MREIERERERERERKKEREREKEREAMDKCRISFIAEYRTGIHQVLRIRV